ncbi:hypothetical protein J2T09_000825 [Neorhizobium huautlense]|uniref:Protein transcription factor n=1 Tax=Neorhizobium huautlense TaxID=67774 RepID=A0ABT9PNP2_9HYPH|nr:type II toxin-antitoxin system VapB family antitoxin [Neorhizobium huautlense]MDP9836083.1 hypothetical protein [Neorhizobium huautlense]
MTLNIRNEKADMLAQELARLDGTSVTDAVITALEETLGNRASASHRKTKAPDAAPETVVLSMAEQKARLVDRLQKEISAKKLPAGPDAARSQDFLYDDHGLPK